MKLVGHEDPLVGRQLEPAKALRCQEHQIWVLFFGTCCVTIFVVMCKMWAAFFEEYPPWLLQILQVVSKQQRWRDKLSKLGFKMFQVFLVHPTPTNFSANVTRKIRKKSSIIFLPIFRQQVLQREGARILCPRNAWPNMACTASHSISFCCGATLAASSAGITMWNGYPIHPVSDRW